MSQWTRFWSLLIFGCQNPWDLTSGHPIPALTWTANLKTPQNTPQSNESHLTALHKFSNPLKIHKTQKKTQILKVVSRSAVQIEKKILFICKTCKKFFFVFCSAWLEKLLFSCKLDFKYPKKNWMSSQLRIDYCGEKLKEIPESKILKDLKNE